MANIQKRMSRDGEVSYRVQVRLKGFPPQTASFTRLTDAKRWEQATEASIREGRYFKGAAAKKCTLAELIEKYVCEVLDVDPRDTYNQRLYLDYWKTALGNYTVADVTPALISEHRNKLIGSTNKYGKTRSLTSANRYTTALGHVFTIALKEWQLVQSNPVRSITKLKEPKGRTRFLSDEERQKLLSACQNSGNPHLYCIVVVALSTGARKDEIRTLKWKDVDFKRGQITLHDTKNGETRSVPLQSYALELVRLHHSNFRRLDSPYVFPSSSTKQPVDIRTAWENAVTSAKLEDFRFHDLRHTAASYLAMNGATLPEIADVLGHKTLQMVKRYAHFTQAHTASVVARMNDKMFGAQNEQG